MISTYFRYLSIYFLSPIVNELCTSSNRVPSLLYESYVTQIMQATVINRHFVGRFLDHFQIVSHAERRWTALDSRDRKRVTSLQIDKWRRVARGTARGRCNWRITIADHLTRNRTMSVLRFASKWDSILKFYWKKTPDKLNVYSASYDTCFSRVMLSSLENASVSCDVCVTRRGCWVLLFFFLSLFFIIRPLIDPLPSFSICHAYRNDCETPEIVDPVLPGNIT